MQYDLNFFGVVIVLFVHKQHIITQMIWSQQREHLKKAWLV